MYKRILSFKILFTLGLLFIPIFIPLIAASSTDWQIQLTSTIDIYTDNSIFGVRNDATDNFDLSYDQIDPPLPVTGVASYFLHPNNPASPVNMQKLSTSIIPPSNLMTWQIQIIPKSLSGELTIKWTEQDINTISENLDVILKGPAEEVINMKQTTQHTFTTTADTIYNLLVTVEEKTETNQIIESCISTGALTDVFNLTDQVWIKAHGLPPLTYVDIYVVEDVQNWNDGKDISSLAIKAINTEIPTDANGQVPLTSVWSSNLTQGKYDIILDANQNGNYEINLDAIDDNSIEITSGFIVIHEFWLKSIVGFIMFLLIGLLFFKTRIKL